MAKLFTTNFLDDDNAPAAGLSPIIKIRNATTGVLVKTDTMTEIGDGLYKYSFEEYDEANVYVVRCDANTDIVNRYTFGASEVSVNLSTVVDAVWETNLDDYTDVDSAGYKVNVILHPKVKFAT